MGEAEAFVCGQTALIGPPDHLDVEGAMMKEHKVSRVVHQG